MGPQPETITDDILSELGAFKNRSKANAFSLNKYRREAEKLKDIDPSGYHTILGAIACLETDVINMHKHHQNAILLSGNGISEVFNYIASLDVSCLWKEAYELSIKAYNEDKSDISRLKHVFDFGRGLLRYHDLQLYLQNWNKLKPDEEYFAAELINRVVDFMNERSLTDNDFAEYSTAINGHLHKTGVIITTVGTALINDKIYIDYKVDDDNADIIRLNQGIKEIAEPLNFGHLFEVKICHEFLDDAPSLKNEHDVINRIVDDLKDTLVAQVCIAILKYMLDFPVTRLRHMTYGSVKNAIGNSYTDMDILKAIQYLCGERVHLLESGFEFIDDDKIFPLSISDVKHTQTEQHLIHPVSGEPINDFEDKIIMFFEPSLLAKQIGQ